MMKTKSVEATGAFADLAPVSRSCAVANLGRAAYTLFVTPKHEKLHAELEEKCLNGSSQPLQPPVNEITKRIVDDILPRYDIARPAITDSGKLIQLAGALIQFGDHVPKIQNAINPQYEQIKELQQAIVSEAVTTQPLDFADQLDVALDQTKGNLTESIWRLLIASRQYARWLDSGIINGIPEMSKEDKIAEMLIWRNAIAACKEPNGNNAQDPSGDNYYTWTHALAKVAYTLAPKKQTHITRAGVWTFERGTRIMHTMVHTFNKQGVESDHSVAAQYGNAIGQAVINAVK